MAIDQEFFKKLKPVEKHFDHYIWGSGKKGSAVQDEKVKAAYTAIGKPIEPLGIHGTYVAVDWDDCIADGSCLPVCPTTVFDWAKNLGKSGQDDRLDYTDKSDPTREIDCIFCMACVSVCPTQAIKVDQELVALHNQITL